MKNAYGRFAAMIATSVAAMYAMTYLNSWALDHVFFSESRLYMVFYMGAVMAVIMLAYMLGMYTSRAVNAARRWTTPDRERPIPDIARTAAAKT